MRKRKAYSPSEHDIQASFNTWFQQRYSKKGILGFAIENAQNVNHGIGSVMKRKARGVTKGVADFFVAKPAGGFCGLFLEFKTEFSRAKSSSESWLWSLGFAGRLFGVLNKRGTLLRSI